MGTESWSFSVNKELTDRQVAGMKPANLRAEYKDGRWPLWLIVQPTGTKSFQWRGTVQGRDRRKTLGRYYDPRTGSGLRLAEARRLALTARADQTGATAEAARTEQASPPVRHCYKLYMQREGAALVSAPAKWLAWHRDIEPAIGDKPIATVTRGDVSEIIANRFDLILDAGGTGVGANRLHAHLSAFFRWSIKSGWRDTRLEHNPMALVEKLAPETVRKRVLDARELKWFWQAMQLMGSGRWNDASPVYARGFELLLRTLTRRSEIFNMRWGWVTGDKLLIPETKNSDDHLLWLHPSAVALIGDRPDKASNGLKVFGVNATSMEKPMRRLRQAMSDLAEAEGETIPHWSLHDLRRTAHTTMGGFLDDLERPLIPKDIRERLMNHREGGVDKHYDHHLYYAEKKSALRIWNGWLDAHFK